MPASPERRQRQGGDDRRQEQYHQGEPQHGEGQQIAHPVGLQHLVGGYQAKRDAQPGGET